MSGLHRRNLGPQAKELLALVECFGSSQAPLLQAAVYEFEDPDAPPAKRAFAKGRLVAFLGQVRHIAKDVGTERLAKCAARPRSQVLGRTLGASSRLRSSR